MWFDEAQAAMIEKYGENVRLVRDQAKIEYFTKKLGQPKEWLVNGSAMYAVFVNNPVPPAAPVVSGQVSDAVEAKTAPARQPLPAAQKGPRSNVELRLMAHGCPFEQWGANN